MSVKKQQIMNTLGEMIGVADIMYVNTSANTGTPNAQNGMITCTLGSAASGETFYSNAELFSVPGIISAPLAPTQASSPTSPATSSNNNVAAQAIYYNFNDQKTIIGVRDVRNGLRAGTLNPGETCVYAPGSQNAALLLKNDDSASLVTSSSGNTVGIFVTTTAITIANQYGGITIDSNGVTITSGQAALTLTPDGTAQLMGTQANVIGGVASISGTSATMIGPQATPATPVLIGATPSLVSTALYGVAGPMGLPSPSILLSTT